MSRRTPHPCAVYVFLHNVQSGAVICGSRNEAHKREMNGHKAPCAESRRDARGGSLTRRDPKCVKQFNGLLSGCEFCPLRRAHSDHAPDSPHSLSSSPRPHPHPHTPTPLSSPTSSVSTERSTFSPLRRTQRFHAHPLLFEKVVHFKIQLMKQYHKN